MSFVCMISAFASSERGTIEHLKGAGWLNYDGVSPYWNRVSRANRKDVRNHSRSWVELDRNILPLRILGMANVEDRQHLRNRDPQRTLRKVDAGTDAAVCINRH